MPYKDPEKAKEYHKQLYQKNKEKRKQQRKEYYEKNKDKRKEYLKKNKDKIKEKSQTEKGIKSHRINNWKCRNIIHHNFDELYEKYINTEHCELCNIKLTEDKIRTKTTRCLDHCHETGEVRNIVCHSCNCKLR